MGAHDITLDAGRVVDGKDVSTFVNTKSASGVYTGDGSSNKAIAHGLGVAPDIVLITDATNKVSFRKFGSLNTYIFNINGNTAQITTADTSANFYVHLTGGSNINSHTYYWAALGV